MSDHAPDPPDRLKLRDSTLARLAVLGAAAVTAGVVQTLSMAALRAERGR